MQRCLGCMREFSEKYDICPHCGFIVGTPAKHNTHLPPGTTLQDGHYILGKVLGQGGFGITYIAWNNNISKAVAVKEYLPSAFATRMTGEKAITYYSEEARQNFEKGLRETHKEAHALSKFFSLDGVVKVHDCIEENGTAYIIMELLHGRNIRDILAERGKLSFKEMMHIMTPVLETLDAMHKKGMIHRDVAPDNIFLCDDGKIKLLDFGAARVISSDDEKTMAAMVKEGFAPPEQYSNEMQQGAFTDVYAAAATMYMMLTGKRPPVSLSRLKNDGNLDALAQSDAPPYVQKAILRGMAPYADDRFQSVDAFLDALQWRESPPKRWWKIVLAAVLVALAAGTVAFCVHHFKKPPEETTTASVISAVAAAAESVQNWTETETETTEPAQTNTEWIEAYKTYLLDQIEQYEAADFTDDNGRSLEPQFSLIYLDEDNNPELVISESSFRDARAKLVLFSGGKRIIFSDLGFYGSFQYAEKQGIIVEEFDRKAMSSIFVSRLTHGKLEDVWMGTENHYYEYTDGGEVEYYLDDDIEVSKEEFEEGYAANVPTSLTDPFRMKATSTLMTKKNVEAYFAAVADPGKVATVRAYNSITLSGTMSETQKDNNGEAYHEFVLDKPVAVQFEDDDFPALLTTVLCHDDANDALPSGHITVMASPHKDSDGKVWIWASVK